MKKKTILEVVTENIETLQKINTHTELREWGVKQGFDNRSAFPKYKAALLTHGINYDLIKTGIVQQSEEERRSKCTHKVTLFVDAKASANGFGICDANENVLWYGKFYYQEDAGEQSKAELCAASKAVWLASKIKEAINAEIIELELFVDAQWLTYQSHGGQKGYKLTQQSKKLGVILDVQWIPGKKNPADVWTTASGYKKWNDNDLATLAIPVK